MPVQPITQAGVPVARPQPLRCLCGYGHDDGFTIMCQRCLRWCHGLCFDIAGREYIPEDWQCWVCAPDSLRMAGLDKGKAIKAQKARLDRIENERRSLHFNSMEQIPALMLPALNVKESYDVLPSMKSIDLRDDVCKSLLDRTFELLVEVKERLFYDDDLVHQATLPEELTSFFLCVKTHIHEWSNLSTVKVHIRNREILETIQVLSREINRIYGIVRHGPRSFIPLEQQLRFAEAIESIKQTRDRTSKNQDGPNYIKEPVPLVPSGQEEVSEGSLPYRNLLHVVRRSLQPYSEGIEVMIHAIVSEFSSLDPLVALARCRRLRLRLLEVCSIKLQEEQKQSINEAIGKDESLISDALVDIFKNKHHDDIPRVLQLQNDDAESFMDLVQLMIETNNNIRVGTTTHRNAHRLLVKLCESSGILPSALNLQGIKLLDANAIYGGGFADIYRGSYRGQDVALKRMRVFQRGSDRHKIHRAFCKEALLWKRLEHPHLLPFIGVDCVTFSPLLCMVSPWMHRGTLIRYVAEHPNVDLEELLLQTANALQYLHSNNVVHGDLRGGNILIGSKGEARLADFGLTTISEATAVSHTSNASGSSRWMAPELHDPESFDLPHFMRTPASDVYAYACVCLETYTGAVPFSNLANDSTVMLRVVRGERPERPRETRRVLTDSMWEIIEVAWAQQPTARPPISSIVHRIRPSK